MPGAIALAERLDKARRRADLVTRTAGQLCAESVSLVSASRSLRARRGRAVVAAGSPERSTGIVAKPAGAEPCTGFRLEGLVGGTPVMARLDGDVLTCDPLLHSHAEIVVALGETFSPSEDGQPVSTSLAGSPLQLLVTLMRAMQVTKLWYLCDGIELAGEVEPSE